MTLIPPSPLPPSLSPPSPPLYRQELDALQRDQSEDDAKLSKYSEQIEIIQARRAELVREATGSRERLAQLNAAHARAVAERKERNEELSVAKGQVRGEGRIRATHISLSSSTQLCRKLTI